MNAEDEARIEALRDFYARFGYPMPDALIRARVLYYSQIGFYALEVREDLPTRLSYTETYYECFSGRHLSADRTDAFRRHILDTYGDHLS